MLIKNGIAKQRDYIHLAFDRLVGNAGELRLFEDILPKQLKKHLISDIFYNMFDYLNSGKNLKYFTKNIKKRFTKKSQRIIICKLS